MKSRAHTTLRAGATMWSLLVVSCSADMGALGPAHCNDSMTCCIQKFPWDPMGACGASASDIEKALQSGVILGIAHHLNVSEGTDDPDDGWREHCRNTYVKCQDQKKPRWVGNCYDCFRWCEGQRQWPFHMCWPQPR